MKQARENLRRCGPRRPWCYPGRSHDAESQTKVDHLFHCAWLDRPYSRPFNLEFFEPMPFLTPFGNEAPIFLDQLIVSWTHLARKLVRKPLVAPIQRAPDQRC
jgi:hypothetical protein